MIRPGEFVLAPLLLGAVGLSGCSDEPSSRPNLLLLTVDTLRADHLEPYGAQAPISPNVAALARDSVLFEDAWSSSSWTLPALASLMTGRHTTGHGCWNFRSRLGFEHDTLAERLTAVGYDTAAVVSHVFLAHKYGLSQGFVDYDDELILSREKSHEAITSQEVSDRGIAYLQHKAAAADGRPWFLWLHYFDPHYRYRAHEREAAVFGDEDDHALYRGEIAFTDRHMGRVLDALERLRLADDSIVVLTADHGEEWLDHGGLQHGHTLYRELVRVPLLVRAPGLAPRRAEERVSLIDLAPTLLDLLGVDPLAESPGRSLLPALHGRSLADVPVLAELGVNARRPQVALGLGRHKLIVHEAEDRAELYDLAEDPLESRDVAEERPDVVESMLDELSALRGGLDAAPVESGVESISLGRAERVRLEALGYTEGS